MCPKEAASPFVWLLLLSHRAEVKQKRHDEPTMTKNDYLLASWWSAVFYVAALKQTNDLIVIETV